MRVHFAVFAVLVAPLVIGGCVSAPRLGPVSDPDAPIPEAKVPPNALTSTAFKGVEVRDEDPHAGHGKHHQHHGK